MTDLFNEVDEQLRSDRYKMLAAKAAPWVMALAIALILASFGIWGWRHMQAEATAKASETYGEAMDAQAEGKSDEAFRLFGEVAESGPKAYRSLALMQQGAARLGDGKPKEAAALFDQAAEAAPDPVLGDAARLKSALALMDSAPYKDVESRLSPLVADGRPYQVEAREALAFAKLVAGDVGGARGDFVVISLLSDAPASMQRRAEAAIQLIDSGSAKAVPAAVKAAAALPPPASAAGPSAAPQSPASGPQ